MPVRATLPPSCQLDDEDDELVDGVGAGVAGELEPDPLAPDELDEPDESPLDDELELSPPLLPADDEDSPVELDGAAVRDDEPRLSVL
jgi:hypothetical protein